MQRLSRRLAAFSVVPLAAACGGSIDTVLPRDAPKTSIGVFVDPSSVQLAPGSTESFVATVATPATPPVTWSIREGSPAGGVITSAGVYTAPSSAGTFHVVAVALDGTTAEATVTVSVATASGTPLFGTAHSPANLPISYWIPGIQAHYGVSDVVDAQATADLQYGFTNIGSFAAPFMSIDVDSFDLYYAQPGDPTYTIVDVNGNPRACPLDPAGDNLLRVPLGAHVYTSADDQHLAIVDVQRNRIYAFYAEAGQPFGVSGGNFIGKYRGCDVLHGDDAAIQASETVASRYSCTTGFCGMRGIGAGVPTGGNGDSNGLLSPHGVIVPEDFDDAGWTGEAVGTLHHALYCVVPNAIQHGWVWPMQDPGAGVVGRTLKDGQIIRLDPSYPVPPTPAWSARVARTLQVYGCIVSDYGNWGLKFSAQGNWSGLGPRRGANPWSVAGGAPPEASAATNDGTAGLVHFAIPTDRLQVILPHGAAY